MKAVIDTNVLLVANGQHADTSPDCVEECVNRLVAMQKEGITVVDDGYRILGEYRHKTYPNQPKGTGDVFLKWLLRNMGNAMRVELISLTETATDEFTEFPDPALQAKFDAPDRKFAAVAYAHPDKPPVWQATDCKWLDWWPALATNLQAVLEPDLILSGEWCAARHPLDYAALPDWFLLFDVYNRTAGRFWSSARRNALAKQAGLTTVPLVWRGKTTLGALQALVTATPSRYRHGPLEGVVIRRESAQWCEARAKLVLPDFTQAIDRHWRHQPIKWNRVAL